MPDLTRHFDDQMRAQERQFVVVRLAVVVLGVAFLAILGEPIQNRFALIGLLAANDEAGRGSVITFRLPRIAAPADHPGLEEGDDAPQFVRRRRTDS